MICFLHNQKHLDIAFGPFNIAITIIHHDPRDVGSLHCHKSDMGGKADDTGEACYGYKAPLLRDSACCEGCGSIVQFQVLLLLAVLYVESRVVA
jgi:hypothetical protein